MSEIQVTALPVVDFEDPVVRALFSVSEGSLVSNDYAPCRKLADRLRTRPDLFRGMILPSAAAPGEQTLVVFSEWISEHLRVVDRSTCTPPPRLLRLFREIVQTLPTPSLRTTARSFIRALERDLKAATRRELERLLGR